MRNKRLLALLVLVVVLAAWPLQAAWADEPTYPLTTGPDREGTGTVSGAGSYAVGARVNVVATPAAGYVFDYWKYDPGKVSPDDSTSADTFFTMTAGNNGTSIMAVFKAMPTYPLTLTTDQGGTVTGGGSCYAGQTVNVTATPEGGWAFVRWDYDPAKVALSSDTQASTQCTTAPGFDGATLKAVFELLPTYALTLVAEPTEAGTLTGAGNRYPGQVLDLTATPAVDWDFDHWDYDSSQMTLDDGTRASTRCTLKDGYTGATVKAVFVAAPTYAVTAVADPAAAATISGTGSYPAGKSVQLTLATEPGYDFRGWQVTSGGVSVGDDGAFTMPANPVAVTVRFQVRYTLTLQPGQAGETPVAGTAVRLDSAGASQWSSSADKGKFFIANGVDRFCYPDCPFAAPQGYVFMGWKTSADVKVAPGEMSLAKDDTLTALWAKRITVIWRHEDGTELDRATYIEGQPEPTTAVVPTKTTNDRYTYEFHSWVLDQEDDFLRVYIPLFAGTDRPLYKVTQGANSSWRLKSGKVLSLTVTRSFDDEHALQHFTGFKLGKKTLKKDVDYTVERGGVIIHIKASALDKYAVDTYPVLVLFDDGDASTRLQILAAYDDETGTGDNSHMFLWLGLTILGGMGLAVLYRQRRKLAAR